MINLGDEVEDLVTGFSGIAIARHMFLYGDTSITVQPVIGSYGTMPEVEIFQETQLKVTKEAARIFKVIK